VSLPDWHTRKRVIRCACRAVLLGLLFVVASWGYRNIVVSQVTLVIDGQAQHVRTKARTVGQLLEERGLYARAQDVLQPSSQDRLNNGTVVELRRAFPLFVSVDGQTHRAYTVAAKTADFLTALGVTLAPLDRVEPALQDLLEPGTKVIVTRVSTSSVLEKADVPFATEKKNDPQLPLGQRRELVQGRPGLLGRTFAVTYVNGREESRQLVEEETLRQPLNRVVAIGTGATLPAVTAGARGGQVVQTMQGLASWYGAQFHGRRTSFGDVFDKNALTAAHRSFPHNTRLRVTYLKTGRSVEVRVNDYGPHIGGRIIDLSLAAAEAIGLRRAGIGMVRIEVLR